MQFSILAKVILLISFSKESNDEQSGLPRRDLENGSNQAQQNLSLQSQNSEEKVVVNHLQPNNLDSLSKELESLPSEHSDIISSKNLNLGNGQAVSLLRNPEGRSANNPNHNHETSQTSLDINGRLNNPNPNVKTLQDESPTSRELDTSKNKLSGQKIPYQNLETALSDYPILKKVLTKLSEEDNLNSFSPNLVLMLKEREDIRVMCAALFKNDNLQSITKELMGTFSEDFNLEEFISEIIKDSDLNKLHEEMESLMQGNLDLKNQLAPNIKNVEVETLLSNKENSAVESQNPEESQSTHIKINKLENSSQDLTTSSGKILNQSELPIIKPEVNESEIKNQGPKVVSTESASGISSLLQGDDPRPIEPIKKDKKSLIDSNKNSQLIIKDVLEKKMPVKKKKKPLANAINSKHNKKNLEGNHDFDENLSHVLEDRSNVKVSDNKSGITVKNDSKESHHKNHENLSVNSKTTVPSKHNVDDPEQDEDLISPNQQILSIVRKKKFRKTSL